MKGHLLTVFTAVLGATLSLATPAGGAQGAASPTPPTSQPPAMTFGAALELATAQPRTGGGPPGPGHPRGRGPRGRAVGQSRVFRRDHRDAPHGDLAIGLPIDIGGVRSRRIDLARAELKLADVDDAAALRALRRERAAGLLRPAGGGGEARARRRMLEVASACRRWRRPGSRKAPRPAST